MLLLPCTFIYSLRLACCVCVYACVYACVRDHKRASIHVWSLCLYSTMHMHQLSYDKSTDFVSIFFLSIFFFSFPPSLLPYLPTSLLRTPTLSLSLSLRFPPFLSRVSPSSATHTCTCFSFPSVHTHATHTPTIATALRTLLFSSSSLDSRLLCHGNGVIQGSARARARNT